VTFYGFNKEYGKFDEVSEEIMTTCLKEKNLGELSKFMSYSVYFRSPEEILEPFESKEFSEFSNEFFERKEI